MQRGGRTYRRLARVEERLGAVASRAVRTVQHQRRPDEYARQQSDEARPVRPAHGVCLDARLDQALGEQLYRTVAIWRPQHTARALQAAEVLCRKLPQQRVQHIFRRGEHVHELVASRLGAESLAARRRRRDLLEVRPVVLRANSPMAERPTHAPAEGIGDRGWWCVRAWCVVRARRTSA